MHADQPVIDPAHVYGTLPGRPGQESFGSGMHAPRQASRGPTLKSRERSGARRFFAG